MTDLLPSGQKGGLAGEAAFSLYGLAGRFAQPIIAVWLGRRAKRGKEDGARRGERFGKAGKPRPDGPLVWVHAASVGETVAVLPLIARITDRGPAVLLTTGTVTAAGIAETRLPPRSRHQYVPVDTPGAIGAFLDHWRPDLALFAESELWPTMLDGLHRRGVPLVLANARMSARSFRAWKAVMPLARAVMGRVDLCLAQSLTDAARLRELGATAVTVCGNLKFDVPPPCADEGDLALLRSAVGGRFVVLAASTHPGEEAAVVEAHRAMVKGGKLLTIVAPRHPQRGDALAGEIRAAGLSLARRTRAEPIGPQTDIYLADTIGEMGLWYRLADVAFLGGSMAARGGQNPIEPVKLGVPVLHGIHVSNFSDVYQALGAANGAVEVTDATALAAAIRLLIDDSGERARLAREASACIGRFTGALERIVEALEPYLTTTVENDATSARA